MFGNILLSVDIGTLRETFFCNQLSQSQEVHYPKAGDFLVDNIEVGHRNRIPLWTPNGPTSGFVEPDGILKSDQFTDFSIMPSGGYSLLVKAKRYGRWWLLKGLKEDYRNQTVCVSTMPFRQILSSNNQIVVFSNCVNFS